MFQQSSIRNSHNNWYKVKRGIQIGLLLVVVIWLLNHINKKENGGDGHVNLNIDEDIDFGRKGKAGSENVVFIDSHKRDFDETPETSEAGEQAESSGQHTGDEFSSKEKDESQGVTSNTGEEEPQEEQLGRTDANDDSNTKQNDLDMLNAGRKGTGGEVISDERTLSSDDQSEGGEKTDDTEKDAFGTHEEIKFESKFSGENGSGVEKESTNSLGEDKLETQGSSESISQVVKGSADSLGDDKLVTQGSHESSYEVVKDPAESLGETEGSSENSSELEKEAIDSHGGVESKTGNKSEDNSEDSTTERGSDDAIQSVPREEDRLSIENASSEKNILASEGDISAYDASTEDHTSENGNTDTKTEDEPINLTTSNEEKKSSLPINEVPVREAVETLENSIVNEDSDRNLLVEETKIESKDKTSATSVGDETKNVELLVINEALERDAVESLGDNALDAGKNDVEEEKLDSKSSKDTLESEGDGSSEDQNAGNEAEILSYNNDDKPTVEVLNVEADESKGDNISREENTGNTVSDDPTEPKTKEDTIAVLDTGNVLSAGIGTTDSSNQDDRLSSE